MRLLVTVLRSVTVWCVVFVSVVVSFPVTCLLAVLAYPVDRYQRAAAWSLFAICRFIMWLNPLWSVDLRGRENLAGAGGRILCANHESYADVFVLSQLGGAPKYLAKRELFYVPFLGWALYFAGFVAVRRHDRKSGARALDRLRAYLDHGQSVVIFPEGTRSPTGELGEFRLGAFKLAVDAGRSVVPIALVGTRDVLPRGEWLIRQRAQVRIAVGEPIDPRDATAEQVRQRCRNAMSKLLEELKRP